MPLLDSAPFRHNLKSAKGARLSKGSEFPTDFSALHHCFLVGNVFFEIWLKMYHK